ncbi:hypothetical protein BJ912DRAFT_1056568 [Pholiota molesta]|nr:hypothetical protein BJ912DRAFT_1056568 [Pholiota molesta]
MPALRLSRRRKSSHILFTAAKPGIYGIAQRPVTFAPNVTPVSYVDTEDDVAAADLASLSDPASAGSPGATALFPPSATPAPPPARKRCPPGKRRSQGYIPRPPNAFMLFRADFVRQKHVPGSIETNHGSLSKIIGTCWRQLPLDEKRVWEVRARQEKAAHKAQFPDYRFRPVHNKNKASPPGATTTTSGPAGAAGDGRREKVAATREDERRCEEVAALLLEGKKGEALAAAVRTLDRARERELEMEGLGLGLDASRPPSSASVSPAELHMPTPLPMMGSGMGMHMNTTYMRRPSSVPLPSEFYSYTYGAGAGGIAMPALPFFHSQSRAQSPVASIARQGQQQQYPAAGYNGFGNPFQPEFTFDHDAFAQQHHHHEQHPQDQGFAFADPFAPHHAFPAPAPASAIPPSFTPSFAHAFASGFGHPAPAQRASLGLGRRASSAQAMLMRHYTMPMYPDHHGQHGQVERDESPLPDVEPALFAADFSFGSASSGAVGNGVMTTGDECVSPVDPVSASSAGSSQYDGSPSPADYVHPLHDTGMGSVYAGEEMYAVSVGVGVEDAGMYAMPLELEGLHPDAHVHQDDGMWGKGMEMGMGLEAYFEAGAF